MKILISSHLFYPSVGGIEEVGLLLAEEFHRAGHAVQVITQTAPNGPDCLAFPVVRRPGPAQEWQLAGWCDVCLHNNVSLRSAWPLWFRRRPWVVAHHTWLARPDGRISWRDRLKRCALRRARNISVSAAIARALPVPSQVIENPYRDDLFRPVPGLARDGELIFVGRLVSDKGADLLLDALDQLRAQQLRPRLTIVGDGPEREPLGRQVRQLALEAQVTFTGVRQGAELVQLLNRHQILVIPSRWEEPFGIVALEGIACGCVPVGSNRGGLPDAIGPCGVTFPHGDRTALAAVLRDFLRAPASLAQFRAAAPEHLAKHRRGIVAADYLTTLAEARAAFTPR